MYTDGIDKTFDMTVDIIVDLDTLLEYPLGINMVTFINIVMFLVRAECMRYVFRWWSHLSTKSCVS